VTMSERAEFFRYERKFVAPHDCGMSSELGIKLNPALFSGVYHPRTVNNIYLDSLALRFYFANLQGAATRTKVRIRWYGELLGPVARPVLEFKNKQGLLGQKLCYPLKPFRLDEFFAAESLQNVLVDSELPQEVNHLLKDLHPTLVNSYYRKYYQSADRKYRVTLDSRLKFYRVRPGHKGWLCKAPQIDFQVIELKYDQAHADGAERITAALPFRVTRMSKYILGVESLDGY
jgi:hypothetical protein